MQHPCSSPCCPHTDPTSLSSLRIYPLSGKVSCKNQRSWHTLGVAKESCLWTAGLHPGGKGGLCTPSRSLGRRALAAAHGAMSPDLVAVVEQPRGPWPEGPPRAASPCGGGTDPMWSPQLLLYSSTEELQTLAALRLRVAMLDQQVHLEKVLPDSGAWVTACSGGVGHGEDSRLSLLVQPPRSTREGGGEGTCERAGALGGGGGTGAWCLDSCPRLGPPKCTRPP